MKGRREEVREGGDGWSVCARQCRPVQPRAGLGGSLKCVRCRQRNTWQSGWLQASLVRERHALGKGGRGRRERGLQECEWLGVRWEGGRRAGQLATGAGWSTWGRQRAACYSAWGRGH